MGGGRGCLVEGVPREMRDLGTVREKTLGKIQRLTLRMHRTSSAEAEARDRQRGSGSTGRREMSSLGSRLRLPGESNEVHQGGRDGTFSHS